jgi:Lar family restriction alleviation protein
MADKFDLKPCPFPSCGGKAEMNYYHDRALRLWSQAQCARCGAQGPLKGDSLAATEAWNAAPRPEDASVAEDEQKLPRRWG